MTDSASKQLLDRYSGLLLGTAVGDSLGLPSEGLSSRRIQRRWHGEWKQRLIVGRGMISDDTEHTLFVAQSLLSYPRDPQKFQRALAWKLRWWFASLPAGIGLATAKACLRLWLGFPAHKAAVTSAGSGPAMRSAIIGAYFANDPQQRREFVLASSRLTHRSWQADVGALAVAECTALAMQSQGKPEPVSVLNILRSLSDEQEWRTIISKIESSLAANASVADFIQAVGMKRGITGYSLHVVPVAIYAWLRHLTDFQTALTQALDCGGDTDTVGAIVGAISGTTVGQDAIPIEWLNKICEWPRSVNLTKRVATRLAEQSTADNALGPVPYFWPGVLPRNVFFLAIILAHGFRRLAPPY